MPNTLTRRGFFTKLIGAVVAAHVAPKIAIDIETVPFRSGLNQFTWDKTRIDWIDLTPRYVFYGGYRGGKTHAMKQIMHAMNYGMSKWRAELDKQMFVSYWEPNDAQKRFLTSYDAESYGSIRGLREAPVGSRGENNLPAKSSSSEYIRDYSNGVRKTKTPYSKNI